MICCCCLLLLFLEKMGWDEFKEVFVFRRIRRWNFGEFLELREF